MPDTFIAEPSLAQSKEPLYASQPRIQPRSVKGYYRSLKNAALWGGLALYHLTPLLRWDRGEGQPGQAIQFDIPGRKIYAFDIEVWPQEIYILSSALIVAAIALFAAASLWGRAWCGFACFQTLWTDLFVKVEAFIEGDRNARMRLDQAPLSAKKIMKRTLKHSAWLGISAFFALSFLWYFGDAFTMTSDLLTGSLSGWSLASFIVLLFMTYLLAGFAREQVCMYMCPYGRLQGVMTDEHSKVITYEDWRGEKRQKPGRSRDFANRGHCVDCTMCVQVCPTGIDIRDGSQLGCIGCGLCIDACDSMMEKFNLPKKLISYDSQVNIDQRAGKAPASMVNSASLPVQARRYAYLGLILVTVFATAWAFSSRDITKITVMKDRAPFYVTMSDGQVQNAYTVRVLNKSKEDKSFRLSTNEETAANIRVLGQDDTNLHIGAGQVETFRVFARKQPSKSSAQPLTFELRELLGNDVTQITTVFHTGS